MMWSVAVWQKFMCFNMMEDVCKCKSKYYYYTHTQNGNKASYAAQNNNKFSFKCIFVIYDRPKT